MRDGPASIADTSTCGRMKAWTENGIKWMVLLSILLSGVLPYKNWYPVLIIALLTLIGRWGYWDKYFWPLVIFSLWTVISAVITNTSETGIRSSDLLFIHLFLPLMILPALQWSDRDIAKIRNVVLFSVVYMSVIAVLQSLWGFDAEKKPFFIAFDELHPRGYLDTWRVPGTWEHAMRYPYAVCVFAVILLHLLREKGRGKLSIMSVYILVGLNLWLSKARAAIGAMVIIAPLIHLNNLSTKKLVFAILGGFLAMCALFFVAYQTDAYRHRIDRVLSMDDGRILVWKDSWRLFTDSPIYGYGGRKRVIHAYNQIPVEKKSPEFAAKGTAAHNNFLAIACSYGTIGLILWTAAMLSLLIYCYRHNCRMAFSLLCLYQILGVLYHMSEARSLSTLLFVFVGLDIALSKMRSENTVNECSDEPNTRHQNI